MASDIFTLVTYLILLPFFFENTEFFIFVEMLQPIKILGIRHFSNKPLSITSDEFRARRAALLNVAQNEFPSTYGKSVAAIVKGAGRYSYAPDV